MKRKILRNSLIFLLLLAVTGIWFSFSYKDVTSDINIANCKAEADFNLEELPEDTLDATTLLRRLLNTVQPDDKKWNYLLLGDGNNGEVQKLCQELEMFAFPLLEQINFTKTGSALFVRNEQDDRSLLLFERMTALRKILLAWGNILDNNKRARRLLLIVAKAIRKPVFPFAFELQLSYVEAAYRIQLKDNKSDKPRPLDFQLISFFSLVDYRKCQAVANIVSLAENGNRGEKTSTLQTYFLYRAARREFAQYESLKNHLKKITARDIEFQLSQSLIDTDPTVYRLLQRMMNIKPSK